MEEDDNGIRVGSSDPDIDRRLASLEYDPRRKFKKGFTQGEEFFVDLEEGVEVPSFSVHHDIRRDAPEGPYALAIRDFVRSVSAAAPSLFAGLSYFFDPAAVLKPCFYRLYKVDSSFYLYLLRIDLNFRPLEQRIVGKGDNDTTAAYLTRRLYAESEIIPLSSVKTAGGKPALFGIRTLVQQTWIGETGRGYFVRGIWMDAELSKFFSKLALPPGKPHYPFYPLTCKYRSLCLNAVDAGPDERRELLPILHAFIDFLAPRMEGIQAALKAGPFSEEMPLFKKMRAAVGERLKTPWTGIAVTPYLNANDQKEFRVEL